MGKCVCMSAITEVIESLGWFWSLTVHVVYVFYVVRLVVCPQTTDLGGLLLYQLDSLN